MTCLFLLFVASFLYAHYLIIAPAEGQQIRRERPSNHLRQALCLLRVMNYQRHLCLSRLGCQFYMTSCCILMIAYRYDSLLCSFSKCTPFLVVKVWNLQLRQREKVPNQNLQDPKGNICLLLNILICRSPACSRKKG